MPYKPTLEKVAKKMDGVLEHLKKELAGLRGGRASLSILDNIKVDYYAVSYTHLTLPTIYSV